jgi:hypothetical protein
MRGPPDPSSEGASSGKPAPKSQKSRTQKQNGLISVETQAAFFLLLPIVLLVALLAFAGERQ